MSWPGGAQLVLPVRHRSAALGQRCHTWAPPDRDGHVALSLTSWFEPPARITSDEDVSP
jgi:hypothetical protein